VNTQRIVVTPRRDGAKASPANPLRVVDPAFHDVQRDAGRPARRLQEALDQLAVQAAASVEMQ
jgi:hypothetical protein